MFTRVKTLAALASVGALLAITAASPASATGEGSAPPVVETGSEDVPSVIPEEGDVILGGTTQSTDPTRFDYVPAEPAFSGRGAVGYQPIGGFTFTWGGVPIGLPGFVLQHVLTGSGLTVQQETANYTFGVKAQFCNYQTAFQNRKGSTIYSTRWSSYHSGCSYLAAVGQNIQGPFAVKNGSQCARLYVNGTFKGEQCHNVF
jgi:hypothetical protein